jgi:UDP-N-acetylglucosamine 1-carboxyvinyltransferase
MSEHLVVDPTVLRGCITVGPAKSLAPVVLGLALLDLAPFDARELPATADLEEGLRVLQLWAGEELLAGAAWPDRTVPSHGRPRADGASQEQRSRVTLPLIGALASRNGTARLPYPRGCPIGARPIDLHQAVLEHFGFALRSYTDALEARRVGSPTRAAFHLPARSRGASVQALLTAVAVGDGVYALTGLATTAPEVALLVDVLEQAGIAVRGEDDGVIVNAGGSPAPLAPVRLPLDGIEIASWVAAALYLGDDVEVIGPEDPAALRVLEHLATLGAPIDHKGATLRIRSWKHPKSLGVIATEDGFDSDLFAVLAVLASAGEVPTEFRDDVFPQRSAAFKLLGAARAGCGIWRVHGCRPLPQRLAVADLRHGFACLMLALAGSRRRILTDARVLERGYPQIAPRLRALGVHAEWISARERAA